VGLEWSPKIIKSAESLRSEEGLSGEDWIKVVLDIRGDEVSMKGRKEGKNNFRDRIFQLAPR